jgi:hypothetical protein
LTDRQSKEIPETERTIPPYDAALRSELESLYSTFLLALEEKNLENLLKVVEVTRTDEETLRSELEKDGFISFSNWLLTTYPSLEQGTFLSLKTKGEDLVGYYMAWLPPYSSDYLNLTLVKFLKLRDRWKIVFRLTEMASAAFQIQNDERPLDKALEAVDTSPLLVLERPERFDILEKPAPEPKLTKRKARLKRDLEEVVADFFSSLERRDIEAFLSSVVVSRNDERRLRKRSKKLFKEILENTPDPSNATFVKMDTMGNGIAGYYFIAPYPTNPSFQFVYLRPFVRRGGRWKLVFSLEHVAAMNLNAAASGGNLISRAEEVIAEIPLLHVDSAMKTLFEDAVRDNPS